VLLTAQVVPLTRRPFRRVSSSRLATAEAASPASVLGSLPGFQATLDLPEVRAQARSVDADAEGLKAAIPHLSDVELADITPRAAGLADVTTGHRPNDERHTRKPSYGNGTARLIATGVAWVARSASRRSSRRQTAP
jgi:hypothetical protein